MDEAPFVRIVAERTGSDKRWAEALIFVSRSFAIG